jgi:signal transduction histidine kinase/DNA-binding response OmpR family regulator
MPATDENKATVIQDQTQTAREPITGRILIVDDEERMVDSLAGLLSHAGHTVKGAASAHEAVEWLAREPFDLVITDLRLPGPSGLDVLRHARSQDPDRPVIIMTAYASLEAAVAAIGEGAYDFLIKPIDPRELKLTVERALDRRRLQDSTKRLVTELRGSNDVLSRRVAELNALHEVSMAMSTTADLQRLLEAIIRLASGVVGAEHSSIMLLDQTRGVLTVMAAHDPKGPCRQNTQLPIGESIAGWVAAHGEPVLVEDVESDPRFARRNRPQFETKSLISAPLRTPNGIVGVISLSDKRDEDVFTADDLRLLVTLAAQAAIAIEDAGHYQQLKRQLQETSALHDLSQRLSEVERTDQMVLAVFACLDQLLICDTLQWWLWDAGSQSLRLYADSSDAHWQTSPGTLSAEIEASLLADESKAAAAIRRALSQQGTASGEILTAAVRSLEQPLGVFVIIRRHNEPFSDGDRRLVRLVSGQAERIFDRQRALWNASRLVTMGKMISEISHDLRKPLTNIRGSLQVMRGRLEKDAHTAAILKATEEEVIHLAALVTELVDFSNPKRYRTDRRDLRPLIFRAVGLVEQSAKKNDVEIAVRLDSVLKPTFCDEHQITEALLNILMNAVEAMPHGGTLTVTAVCEPVFPEGSEQVHITVADTGQGMSPSELSRCFERYYTTKATGTGLGLAIVQRIIQAHDGHIEANSTPDTGTTFHIHLPIR